MLKYNPQTTVTGILDNEKTKTLITVQSEEIREKFILNERNKGIQIFIIAISIIHFVLELIRLNGHTNYDDIQSLFISKSILFIGLLLYFKFSNISYILFGLSSLLLIIYSITDMEIFLTYFSLSYMLSIITFYPLFHFDKMTCIEYDEEPKFMD